MATSTPGLSCVKHSHSQGQILCNNDCDTLKSHTEMEVNLSILTKKRGGGRVGLHF